MKAKEYMQAVREYFPADRASSFKSKQSVKAFIAEFRKSGKCIIFGRWQPKREAEQRLIATNSRDWRRLKIGTKLAPFSRDQQLSEQFQTLFQHRECKGAGKLYHSASYDPEASTPNIDCSSWQQWPNECGIASSYKYPVSFYEVSLYLPLHYYLSDVNGVPTILCDGDKGDQLRKCWTFADSRGYALKLREGWLIDGYHISGKHSRRPSDRKIRQAKLAASIRDAESRGIKREVLQSLASNVWITRDNLRKAGACDVGIDEAYRAVRARLNASGEVGAVNAAWIIRSFPAYAKWCERVIISQS